MYVDKLGTFYEDDWEWVQDLCICFSASEIEKIRYAAILSLGHLGRIHGRLDMSKVNPVLKKLREDESEEIRGTVENTIDDIIIYVDPNFSIDL